MTLNEVFSREVPIVISKASPPTDAFHMCEVFRTDAADKIVALIRGQVGKTTACFMQEAFQEAYGIDACNGCVFRCSYGQLEGEGDWSERKYSLRFLGSSRLHSRMDAHDRICQACFERESEQVRTKAARQIERLERMVQKEVSP